MRENGEEIFDVGTETTENYQGASGIPFAKLPNRDAGTLKRHYAARAFGNPARSAQHGQQSAA